MENETTITEYTPEQIQFAKDAIRELTAKGREMILSGTDETREKLISMAVDRAHKRKIAMCDALLTEGSPERKQLLEFLESNL